LSDAHNGALTRLWCCILDVLSTSELFSSDVSVVVHGLQFGFAICVDRDAI